MTRQIDPFFWSGKNVFLTGHTGFKGAWLTIWLSSLGAKVTGYSLPPNTNPDLYGVLNIESLCNRSHFGDIRSLEKIKSALVDSKPDIVIHMAAQSLVRYSYDNPIETYSTNVMGSVHLLEAVRACESVRAVVVITSDKCYENKEWIWGYRENESFGGKDPYSSSKGCAEMVVAAYRHSFFPENDYSKHGVAIATGRAGNVIGGGDWSRDRLIPDAIKAFDMRQTIKIRNPKAIRPWQHVLEPLSGYLMLAQSLFECGTLYSGGWNFGPIDKDVRSVEEVINLMIKLWGGGSYQQEDSPQPYEANLLKLDSSKARQLLGWKPQWMLEESLKSTVSWYKDFLRQEDMLKVTFRQIDSYVKNKNSL
jgi:CDP-glucose 4,6-dehydratase